jgi:hypothetical protein
MSDVGGVHLAAFETEYEAILGRAREIISSFPPHLRFLAGPPLPLWAGFTFSRIVALFPFWVDDLLTEVHSPANSLPPSDPAAIETLGLACLLGWWSYLLQDELLDQDLVQVDLLPLSIALHATATRLLQGLVPGHQAFWEAFEHLSLTMAEAQAREQHLHLPALCDLESQGSAPAPDQLYELEHLADQSALLHLPVVGTLALRGLPATHPLAQSLAEMVRQYAIARQIGDDRADCLQDLGKGRLNYVSACIVQRLWAAGAIQSYADLDAEWLASQFLSDDELFAGLQQVALDACQAAIGTLAAYKARFLRELVNRQAEQLQQSYESALGARHRWRSLFPTSR